MRPKNITTLNVNMAQISLNVNGLTEKNLKLQKRIYTPRSIELKQNNSGNYWKGKLEKNGEMCKILAISANCSQTTEIRSIQLIIFGEIIVDIPTCLINLICTKCTYINGVKTWSLNYNSFLSKHIPQHTIFTSKIEVWVDFVNTVNSAEIVIEYVYLSNEEIEELDKSSESITFQQFHYDTVESIENNNLVLELKAGLLTKGLFIETDVSSLNKITIEFSNEQFVELSNPYLLHYCSFINDNLLWIPFKNGCEIWNSKKESYDGSINLSYIDKIILKLDFVNKPNKITICKVSLNYLTIRRGVYHGPALIDNFKIVMLNNK